MKKSKQLLAYFSWTLVALMLGIIYMRLLLGPVRASDEGVGYLIYRFYQWGILSVGLAIGGSTALLFILLNVLFLNKKLKHHTHPSLLRLGMLLGLFLVVIGIHYLLEKVIDSI